MMLFLPALIANYQIIPLQSLYEACFLDKSLLVLRFKKGFFWADYAQPE